MTTREVEVLRLVAGGRSNLEIADELSLSIRTVEGHIWNIYRKIGARGRAADRSQVPHLRGVSAGSERIRSRDAA